MVWGQRFLNVSSWLLFSFILSFSVWVGRAKLFGLKNAHPQLTPHPFFLPYTKLHPITTLDLLSFSFSLGSAHFFFFLLLFVLLFFNIRPV